MNSLLGQPLTQFLGKDIQSPEVSLGIGLSHIHAQNVNCLIFDGHIAQIRTADTLKSDPAYWPRLLAHRDNLLGAPEPVEDDLSPFEQAAFDLLIDPYQQYMFGGAVFGIAAKPLESYLAFELLKTNGRKRAIRAMLRSLNLVARVTAVDHLKRDASLDAEDRRVIEVISADPAPFMYAPGGCIAYKTTAQEILNPAPPTPRKRWWRR